LLNHQNNYVERLSVDNKVVKNFNILATSLNSCIIIFIIQNYFSDLYLTKFFDILAKFFRVKILC